MILKETAAEAYQSFCLIGSANVRPRSLVLWDMTKHTVIGKIHSDDIPIEKKALNRQLLTGCTPNVANSHNRLL